MNMNDAFVGSLIFNRNSGGGGGASAMSDLTDVNLTGLANGDSLVYNDTDSEWQSQSIIKVVTQLEYDALVEAGTVDPNTSYYIKDANGDGSKFQPVIYSLEEREIGVWTDGKPLYECAFYSTTKYGDSDTALVLNSQIPSNIDVIGVQTELNIEARDGGNVYKFASTSAGWFSAYYDINNNTFYAKQTLSSISKVSSCLTSVVLRYTKQADQAGSGTWTPQGVPAVHYSTDEQVVGTWVDGKTLFEKTIARTFSGDEVYTVFASGVDIAFVTSCFFEYTSGSNRYMSPYYISSASTVNNISINSDVVNGALTLVNQTRSSKYFVVTVRYTKSST